MAVPNAGIQSLETNAKVARFAIWAVLISVLPLVGLYMLLLFAQLSGEFPSLTLYGMLALANTAFYLLMLISGIIVLFWIYRAHANLRDAGVEELKHSPVWAVVCWFIPFVSLVSPFTTMRALYNRSHGEEAWNSDASVGDVASWWTCYLVGSLILVFTMLTFLINALPGVWLTTPPAADTALNIGAYLLMACAAWFLMKIMAAITLAQRQRVNAASAFE